MNGLEIGEGKGASLKDELSQDSALAFAVAISQLHSSIERIIWIIYETF